MRSTKSPEPKTLGFISCDFVDITYRTLSTVAENFRLQPNDQSVGYSRSSAAETRSRFAQIR